MDQCHWLERESVKVDQCHWLDGESVKGVNAIGSTKDAGKKRSCVKGHHNLSESWADGLTSVKEMVASDSRN